MTEKSKGSTSTWVDPDDGIEWTEEMFRHAEYAIGGKVIRPATGKIGLTKGGRPKVVAPKQQVSVRLDQDVLAGLKALGPGWQGRMNAALREWLAKR